ncbi:MAG: efflux transporter outer membrane subunit [Verrucomicrobia bacterium]|nr:efflux transporter outer membrane subunit [Verrucomicrobiota bacterium]MBI3871189.1 efflux transporter outer membrane subunit [Verrucomicrobiota bacterium]
MTAFKPGLLAKSACGRAGLALVLLGLMASGCAVGPNYQRPPGLASGTLPDAFREVASTNKTEWKAAVPSDREPRGPWWGFFADPELDRLERLATARNQQLAVALANFAQARAALKVARADGMPQVSANPGVTRQRTSANLQQRFGSSREGATTTTYDLPVEASWELDLWGRVRRQVEGARGRLAASWDDLETFRLSVQAEVAFDYLALCSSEAQRQVVERSIETYRRSLALTRARRRGGVATGLDVSQAETQLKAAEALLPSLELQQIQMRDALGALCGESATTFQVHGRSLLALAVSQVPVGVPSELLERRPDVAAAERRMAAANADIGLARAAFYPRVTLGGGAGLESVDAGVLFDWPSRFWSVGPSLQMPLFTGGRNRARLASARAAHDAAVAAYRQTVLTAFQEVEDQLAAQRLLAKQLVAEQEALDAARRTLEISTTRYKDGVITFLEVALSQSTVLTHEQTTVQVKEKLATSAVSLIKALGAGWEGSDSNSHKGSEGGPAAPSPSTTLNAGRGGSVQR